MGHIYIKFKTDDIVAGSQQGTGKSRFMRSIEDTLINVAFSIIPKANPDFDGKIQHVRQWILEVDDEEGTTDREIGLDENGTVIMIMPWRKNYGFWTDSNVGLDELAKSHEMQFVDEQEFQTLWSEFDTRNKSR